MSFLLDKKIEICIYDKYFIYKRNSIFIICLRAKKKDKNHKLY